LISRPWKDHLCLKVWGHDPDRGRKPRDHGKAGRKKKQTRKRVAVQEKT